MAVAANVQSKNIASGRSAPKLIPLGLLAGKPPIPLDRPVTSVGARENCRIHLISRSVSQNHALLVNSNGGTYICDLASREGVLVNDVAVRHQPLQTGDRIQIGKFLFEFRAAKNAPPPTDADAAPAAIQIEGKEAVAIEDKTLLIGRREDVDVPFPTDGDVSALHAFIFPVNGQWYLRDLNSRTGTKINGKAVHQEKLEFGDEIRIGKAVLRIEAAVAGVTEQPAGELTDVDSVDHLSGLFEPESVADAQRTDGHVDDLAITPLAEALPAEADAIPLEASEDAKEPAAPRRNWRSELAKESLPPGGKPPAREVVELPEEELKPVIEEASPLAENAMADIAETQPQEISHDDLDFLSEKIEPQEPVELEDIAADLEPIPTEHLDAAATPVAETPAEDYEPLDLEAIPEIPAEEVAEVLHEDREIAPVEIEHTEAPAEAIEAKHEKLDYPDFDLVAEGGEPAAAGVSAAPAQSATPPIVDARQPAHGDAGDIDEHSKAEMAGESEADELDFGDPIEVSPLERGVEIGGVVSEQNVNAELDEFIEVLDRSRAELDDAVVKIEPLDPEPPVLFDEVESPETATPIEAALVETDAESPNVEILDRTEPTLESALDLPALPEAPASQEGAAGSPPLSDTTFGRAVEEFTGTSTGPIIEPVAEQPAPASEAVEVHRAQEVSDLSELDEFVAMPEDVPADASDSFVNLLDLDDLETQEADSLNVEEPLESAPVLEADEKPTHGSSVEQPLSFADPSADEASPTEVDEPAETVGAQAEEPNISAAMEEIPPTPAPGGSLRAQAAAVEKKPTPPLFGFSFDGASFIGGMPLKLKQATASAPEAPAVPPRPKMAPSPPIKAAQAFDPKTAGVSRLSTMKAIAPPEAPAKPAAAAVEQKRPIGPTFEKAAKLATPPGGPPYRRPPQWAPPPPRRGATAPPAEPPRMFSGFSTPSEPPGESSSIPTLQDDVVVPPLARPQRAAAPVRRPLSTAFDGLTSDANPLPSADVFSQVTAPISSASFGVAAGNLEDFASEEITRSPVPQSFGAPLKLKVPPGAGAPPNQRGGAGSNGQGRAKAPLARSSRARVPLLLVSMVVLMAGAWALVYLFFPHYSKVAGSLGFANIDKASMAEQRTFEMEQISRLGSEEVRTVAKALLSAQNKPVGFLDDAIHFDQAVNKDGNVHFDGSNLEVVTQVSDGDASPQMTALLMALKQRDADLVDTQARAKASVDAAKFAVEKATIHLEDINSQIKVLQAAGDQRPDPLEVAKEEAEATRLAKVRDGAKAARVEVQLEYENLRQMDTSKPIDPDTDVQLVQLRKQLSDLNEQIAELKSPTSVAPPPADAVAPTASQPPVTGGGDAASNAELIKQLQAQADSTRSQISLRMAVVQADQKISPAQREVNRQKTVEDLTIKLARLQSTEADAVATANAAATTARQTRQKLESAQLALARMDELPREQAAAETDLKNRSDDQAEQQRLLDLCIVPSGDPQVNVEPMADQRPIVAGIGSGVFLLVFSYMIVLAARGPVKSAAPMPVSPLPWPKIPEAGEVPEAPTAEPAASDPPQEDQEAVTI